MDENPECRLLVEIERLAELRFAIERVGEKGAVFSYRRLHRDYEALVQEFGSDRVEKLFDQRLTDLREKNRTRDEELTRLRKSEELARRKVCARDYVGSLSDLEIRIVKALRRVTGLDCREIFSHFLPQGPSIDHALWALIASDARWTTARPASIRGLFRYVDLQASPDPALSAKIATLLASARPHPTILFGYRFHPVGQGLFTSGFVSRRSAPFHWVYDCGTASKQAGMKAAIAQLGRALLDGRTNRGHLHLVAISHFDADHINGLLDLLREFSVDTLLLPYLTPWERLLVALHENALGGSDFVAFLAAPTAFILGREESRINRILLVPPGTEEPAPPGDRLPAEDLGDELRIPSERAPAEADEAIGSDPGLTDPRVEKLTPGRAITIGRVWEFLPYNDASVAEWATMPLADKEVFCREAQGLVDQLKVSDVRADRAGAQAVLNALKALYDDRFGGRGRKRNIISLFLYGGPIGTVRLLTARERHRWIKSSFHLFAKRYLRGGHRFGQMMTGDGFLETVERFAAFDKFYRPYGRLERGANFQVMHHGSKHNWCSAVARAAKPLASLFSSEPSTHEHHPDSEVWRDFRPYHRRQIDSRHGWSLIGAFRFD